MKPQARIGSLRLTLLATGALAGILLALPGHAEMLLSQSVMVKANSAPHVETLGLSAAGTVTISVSDLKWPEALQSLSFAITDATTVLQRLDAPGELTYKVMGPATLFANFYATPNPLAGVGLYHFTYSFVPAVPIPAAGWLLLSGLAGLSAFKKTHRSKHAPVTNAVVQ